MRRDVHFAAVCVITFLICSPICSPVGFGQVPGTRAGWHLVNGQWLRAGEEAEFSDLFQVRWQGDDLRIAVATSPHVDRLLGGGRHAGVDIGSARNLYDVSMQVLPRPMGPGFDERKIIDIRALLEHDHDGVTGMVAADDPKPSFPTSPLRPMLIIAKTDSLRLECRGDWQGRRASINFLSVAGKRVQLSVRIVGKTDGDSHDRDSQSLDLSAESLSKLMEENPKPARKFLSPVLRMLQAEGETDLLGPGASDVFREFPEIAPSPAIVARVKEILPRMLDDDSIVREAAVESINKLGEEAVRAVAQLRLDDLAPQQRIFIEQILRDHSRPYLAKASGEELRGSRLFLSDCLSSHMVAVRRAAAEKLGLSIDPRDRAACVRAAEQLQRQLLE